MGRPNLPRQSDSHDWPYSMLFRIATCAVIAAILLPPSIAAAQRVTTVSENPAARSVTSAAEINKKQLDAAKAAAKAAAAKSEGDKSKDEKAEGEKSEGDKDEKAKEDDKPDSLKRPTVPPRVPDPREFDVRPDKNARITFTFHGQPWPDVLQWRSRRSGKRRGYD